MAKRTPPKKKTQRTKAPRISTRIASRNNRRHGSNHTNTTHSADSGPRPLEVDPVLNHGVEFVDSIMNDIEEIRESDGVQTIHGITNLETSRVLDFVIRRVTQPLREVFRRSISFASYYFQSPDDIQALQRGRDFVASVMNDLVEIPNSDGMRVMYQVRSLESDVKYNIVIRDITQPFWKECIKEVKTPNMTIRVCAVGTPGTGKTTSTPFLIRMLFEEKATVVYRLASADYFWEFTSKNKGYDVTVYRKGTFLTDICSLKQASTFYIVDPGTTIDNCLPDVDFKPRTIIVSSPDERNWGSGEFEKRRSLVKGRFRYFPLWDLTELRNARSYMSGTALTDEEFEERFRLVGGIPRHMFEDKKDISSILQSQNDAISDLTITQAEEIVRGDIDAVGLLGNKNAIMGYVKTHMQGTDPFSSRQVDIISSSVEEKVSKKFIAHLWNQMLKEDHAGWTIFKTYCRVLIATPPGRSFLCRPCCGRNDEEYDSEYNVMLEGCDTIRRRWDPVSAVLEGVPMTLFHSMNPNQNLFDFIYKDCNGMFHAFQVTLGKRHSAQAERIRELRMRLGTSRLALYYVIPADNRKSFVTMPTNPATTEDRLTSFWHILIPNPEQNSLLNSTIMDSIIHGSNP